MYAVTKHSVFYALGRQHLVFIERCDCEEFSITLVRHNLWPASPDNPTVAVSIELMLLMKSMVLECHVSAKKFFDAVWHKDSLSRFSFKSKVCIR